MNINYNMIFKNLITLLSIVLIAYLINTVLYFYLPKEKVEKIEKTTNTLSYKRYEVKSAFTVKKEIKKQKPKKVVEKKKEYQFLSNITLLAIYDMGNQSGFVTVQEKGKSETHVLGIDENFKGYKLDKVFAKYAIFTKNSKEYRLSLTTDNKKLDYEVVPEPKAKKVQNTSIQVIDEDRIAVKRDHVNSYIKNVDKIWNDIAIAENLKNGKIDGFKIQRIKKNSDFEKLGLQKNDVIKSVNNIQLKSYNDAFKLYKKFNNTKALNIKIMRNNQEVEINYEIE